MKIKDICISLTDGSHNPPQGVEKSEYLMISSKNIFDDEINFYNPRYLDVVAFEKENNRTKIKQDDVLLTIVGTVGRTAVVTENMPKFTLQRSVAVLHPNKDICLSRYLMYALQGKRKYIENKAKGVAQKGIYLGEIANIDIVVPSMAVQRNIIEKLDCIKKIINNHNRRLFEFDNLVKSRFFEVFGDPISNPKNWEMNALESNAKLLNGRAYKQDELLDEGKYPVLRVGNFFSNREWYYSDLELEKDKYCDKGDLLYAWSASFGPQIWKGERVIYHYHIWKVIVGGKYNKVFLCNLLEYVTSHLMSDTHGIAMMHLTKGGMEKTEFIVPPIELQNEFANFVNEVDKSKVVVQKALDEAQMLFDSLMQEYFG